jgi:hypothetical protein
MFLRSLIEVLRTILYGWIVALLTLLRALFRRPKDDRSERDRRAARSPCVPIDDPAFVRPDPLLYSQQHLMALGLAVTWDNPDIVLFHNGMPVPSHALQPDTVYDVRSRIWNDSFDAPVINMAVHLSYLDFGIGTTPIPVATATGVDVGVKGSATQPAFVSIPWRTPAQPGHYCLQVLLDPVDDRDGTNNLGQENTDVGAAHSPASFTFTLHNGTRREHRYRFDVNAYELRREPCRKGEDARHRLERHRRGNHPLPAGWSVAIAPEHPSLAPGASTPIQVTVTPPAGFVGAQRVNVDAFTEAGPAGGVTLTVTGS